MQNCVVLKFGGSSMGDNLSVGDNLPKISKIIKTYQKEYKNVIVVVSALAGETRRLKQIADLLHIDARQKDEILAQGEIFSSHLLSTYLNQNGLRAIDLNGDLLPIHTNNKPGNADIKEVDTALIKRNLLNQTVIIPGFIGHDNEGHITTLGFDGSDTTALAVASAMQADRICLFKDVNGVYSANPKKVPARQYEQLSLDDMWYFARAGAMIVHPKAIQMAIKHRFDIHILPNFSEGKGTLLSHNCADRDIVGISYLEKEGHLIVSAVGQGVSAKQEELMQTLAGKGIKTTAEETLFNTKKSFSFRLQNPDQLDECLKTAHRCYQLDAGKDKVKINLDKKQKYYDPAIKNVEPQR